MKFKFLKTCSVAAMCGLSCFTAQAATISLQPTGPTDIDKDDTIVFDLYADAADVGGFIGGGLDLFYDDSVLTYNGDFAFDAGFATDPALSRTGDDCAASLTVNCSESGEINGIAFGEFNGLATDGLTLVGSLSFTGADLGTSLLTMTDNDSPAGQWYATDGSGPLTVDYAGAQVNVIPVPAAVWLFGSGLLGLVGVARRKNCA